MRTRTRFLTASALLAATAHLATGQLPAARPAAASSPPPVALTASPPAKLPTTLPVQAPPVKPAVPEGGKPVTPPPPTTPPPTTLPVEPLMPIGPPSATDGCPTCSAPADYGPTPNGFRDDHQGPKDATWFRYEYSLNWFKSSPRMIPIAVASTNGTGPLLLGGDDVSTGMHSGGKVEFGTWTNDAHTFGFGLGGFIIENRSAFETVVAPTMSRPFFDVLSGSANAITVAVPGGATGSMATGVSLRMAGAEANLWWNIAETDCFTMNIFTGFRYIDLDEVMAIYQTTTPLVAGLTVAGQPVPTGTDISLIDRFRTRNQFWGGQLGTRMEVRHGIMFANITPRVGFGPTHQVVQTDGRTTVTGQPPVAGGLYALGVNGPDVRQGNNGRDVANRFTLMSEVGSTVGLQVTNAMRVGIGYNFLYLSNVARPGRQIDTAVNPRLVPVSTAFGSVSGTQSPNQTFDRESFYAHGATFSIEIMY